VPEGARVSVREYASVERSSGARGVGSETPHRALGAGGAERPHVIGSIRAMRVPDGASRYVLGMDAEPDVACAEARRAPGRRRLPCGQRRRSGRAVAFPIHACGACRRSRAWRRGCRSRATSRPVRSRTGRASAGREWSRPWRWRCRVSSRRVALDSESSPGTGPVKPPPGGGAGAYYSTVSYTASTATFTIVVTPASSRSEPIDPWARSSPKC